MATVFRLPDIGEGLTEAEIVEWHAAVGDEVVADRALVTVETDKAQADLPAPITGILLHQGAPVGTVLAVGMVLAVIGKEGESWDDGESWGLEASASSRGVRPSQSEPEVGGSRLKTLPLVRRLANEHGIDLDRLVGTGPGGRITRADVQMVIGAVQLPRREPAGGPAEQPQRPPLVGTLDEVAEDLSTPIRTTAAPPPVVPPPDVGEPAATAALSLSEGDRVVSLSATRKAIAEHMTKSWREIPHVTSFASFDAGRLLEVRRALEGRNESPVSLDALLVKAVIPALRAFPEFNASLVGEELILRGAHHIGVAMDSEAGLLVGVVRDAESHPVMDLAYAVEALAIAVRNRQLSRDQMTGATFTVSNIGAVGGGMGTPIIPSGTTSILSVGRAVPTPVVRDGSIQSAMIAPLSLSYDHRVIDGAMGRRFLAMVVENLEEPALFLA